MLSDSVEFYPMVGKMSVPNQNTESVSFKVSLLKENGEKSEVRRFVVPQDCRYFIFYTLFRNFLFSLIFVAKKHTFHTKIET